MKRFDDINVIPLIDVMLVLLAVVLTTASFIVTDSLDIQLPETQNTQSYVPPDTDPLHLAIDAQGQLFLEAQAIDLPTLGARFKPLDKQTPIVIKVDTKAEFGHFIGLVDLLKTHQLTNLTFLTEKGA
ncbi:biopolymer transporter ExbD [Thiomicrospira sp. WB1]|jgi:biopolymer transport protein ExbD|uniref:biopolymer transporter ExbD n=1 Tax=Thiomicrospira sp. WB1 TaxID=1685380 RepID=UPI000747F89E|nr:biopolymer transporter ExbD [Thiomicrospira sp. WB1]KUJ72551.1 biopolymer transporter ExbD [Thiomicrospira sp. WB1]